MLSNEPIGNIMQPDPLEVRAEETLEQVTQRILPGQIAVVKKQNLYPIGILPEETTHTLRDPKTHLLQFRQHFISPTVTTPGTPLTDILQGVFYNPSIRWHVVMEGNKVVGVVPPEALFQTLRGAEETRALIDSAKTMAFDAPVGEASGGPSFAGGSYVMYSLGNELFGTPQSAPPHLCFICNASDPPHRVWPDEVEALAPSGEPICPDHPSTEMTAENPCRD